MRRYALTTLVALWLLHTSTPMAEERPFIDNPEPIVPKSVKPGQKWSEGEVRLPAWPRDQDLVEIPLDRADPRFTYLLDLNSLSTGDDDVVRYTVIAESASGARNLTFEGLRCTPKGAYKLYAYGTDGRFRPTDIAGDWLPIDGGDDVYRRELWRHYLCVPRLFKPRARRDQVRMLKSGRVPEVEHRGFLTN